jgi:F-type H+-transporting ATPase subunit b
MLIDWFTVGAQVLNFLVLVYLLKRFLYGPIIKAMDEREQKIASRLKEAQMHRDAAEQEQARYEEKNRQLDGQRAELLSAMKHDVEETRKTMMHGVRTEVEGVRANWYEALDREKDAFLRDLQHRVGEHAYALARQALQEMADMDVEIHIARVFEARLRNLKEDEGEKLRQAMDRSQGKAVLRTAFDLPQDAVQGISGFLESLKTGPVDLTLETTPDVVCGIELVIHGHKIAWSLAAYLESLETDFSRAFEAGRVRQEEIQPPPKEQEDPPEILQTPPETVPGDTIPGDHE